MAYSNLPSPFILMKTFKFNMMICSLNIASIQWCENGLLLQLYDDEYCCEWSYTSAAVEAVSLLNILV